ncbi:hypothetical protein CH373_03245 [Leptospira perolatii]|uniref:Uncharacterized protein n=1 Tax=Leptospira perolatii TaxID=2023191 RepID=A0A2M9ZSV9_9LEPT|nr:hypothetical protein [Leptospira perolatii]PJZ71516.1 hypothetical protein CH360_03240 [Leptospira perolatii]PJZ75049.1 hypothetical protein CH373_03245 [Leptospira perolatii]
MNLEFGKWNQLIQAMDAGKRIILHGVVLTSCYQSNLENYLRFCLDYYKKTDLLPPALSLLFALMDRSHRENCRNFFFLQNGWDAADGSDLSGKEDQFISQWDFSSPNKFRAELKEKGFFLRTTIFHGPGSISIEIANNAIIPDESEEDLTEYLSRAKSYLDVSEYFEDYPFDEEGKELGIALAFLQFRDIGIHPSLIRFETSGGEHVFRVELPFDEGFESIREKLLHDEDIRPFPDFHEKETEPSWKTSKCNYCGRVVDDRIFFPKVPEDVNLKHAEHLSRDLGICAWCLSSYI